jgi:hypothetical protein
LDRTVAAQRDEIARLKGGPGRPDIKPNSKPSGMEQATDPEPPGGSGEERRRRGSTRAKLTIDETREIKLVAPPPGARFKGYTLHRRSIGCARRLSSNASTPAGHVGRKRRYAIRHARDCCVPRLLNPHMH